MEERARDLELQAQRDMRLGHYEQAAKKLREAWEIYKNPSTICNLGMIESGLGRARDAAQSLSTCLRLLSPSEKSVLGKRAERELNKVRAQVGTITIDANVPDAEVLVDDKAVGNVPMRDPIFVEPGPHGVEVRAPGYTPEVRMAVMTAGGSLVMRMRLEPMRVEVGQAPGDQEKAPAEAKVEPKVEDKTKGPGLATKEPVLFNEPTVGKGAAGAVEPVRPAVILGGFALGVVGAGVGAASFVAMGAAREEMISTTNAASTASETCKPESSAPCTDVSGEVDKTIVLTALGVAGIAVSIAGGTLVVYELMRTTPQRRTSNARISISAAPSGGGLQIGGSF